MSPNFNFNFVDVRDVASLYLKLLEEEVISGRYIIGTKSMKLSKIASMLKERMPERKIRPFLVPRSILSFMVKYVPVRLSKDLGLRPGDRLLSVQLSKPDPFTFDTSRVEDELGITLSDIDDALVETAQWAIKHGHI
eukprot:CAMPEP_0204874050 /NCGR_PEP_ID=MMETSP1348-20121228/42324_1 /ASSEMBLY_ACC=CAM_ASM_000700 /TAXON_ID=215587 /ORGANISM="Aplanochytrium stocchinoi, Strain GSBS06" /LENGTH=136 /DNA_ID=CAMNT_0052029687 /DNA_START=36 /DNA_END=446 /DNA_ORIENTATION=-